MYKHPEVFSISRLLIAGAKSILENPEKDLEFFVKGHLEKSIGLYAITAYVVNAGNTFWLDIDIEQLEKAMITNILVRYTKFYANKEDIDNWKQMLKQEGL